MLETTEAVEIGGLPDNQQKALAALIQHSTIRDAAAACGLAEGTLYRYKARPEFQAAYKDLKRQAMELAVGRMHSGMGIAVDTLIEVMQDPASPNARVSAAAKMIQYCLKTYYDLNELDELVAELREGLGDLN